jgi:hypothetical protein
VRVLENDVWLVGPPSDLDVSAVVVFTYPLAFDSQTRLGPDQERALLRDLPVRAVLAHNSHGLPDFRWVGLGYYRHPTEPGVVMVLVSISSDPSEPNGVHGYLLKASLTDSPSGPQATCIWQGGLLGHPVPHFAEDVDGDGFTDVLVRGNEDAWPSQWDRLLSGADGHKLAEFGTDLLAVEQKTSGPRRLAVKYLRDDGSYPIARLLGYNRETRAFEPVTTQVDEKALRDKAEGKPPHVATVGRLLEDVKELALVKGYLLPGMRSEEHVPQGVEIIPCEQYRCWRGCVYPNARDNSGLATLRAMCPEVNVFINYVPEGYKKAHAAVLESMLARVRGRQ